MMSDNSRSDAVQVCPVCDAAIAEPIPSFCSNCGWDFKNDLVLGTFLGDIPKSVVQEYHQRLLIVRRIWSERKESRSDRGESENRLKRFESRLAEVERKVDGRITIQEELGKSDEARERESSPRAESRQAEWIEPVTGMLFVHVPAGKFIMGDHFGDGFPDEKPLHEVELDGFYMGKYPVTQSQWSMVMENNPSHFRMGGYYPVENISWHDAKRFIERLKVLREGKGSEDSGYELYLPSEAQWEYAARSGGEVERYSGGDDPDKFAWYAENSDSSTHPPGSKAPNGLGIHDMSGNVLEWCEDLYASDAYSNTGSSDAAGTVGDSLRVIRGGAWNRVSKYIRCAYRYYYGSNGRDSGIGFRLARSL